MKKLIPMMVAAASAFSVFAAADPSGVIGAASTFEESEVGEIDLSGGTVWTGATTGGLEITEYKAGEAYTYKEGEKLVAGETNTKYLAIETEGSEALCRNINNGSAQPIGDGLFIDTLVQFTAADDDQTVDADAKLAIWLQNDEAAGTTNLMVKAATVGEGGALTATNFTLNAGKPIENNSWHRLTVRSIANITGSETDPLVGFALFIDGNAVACADAEYAPIDAGSLTSQAAKDFLEAKQLFVGLVTGQALTAVGFKGKGAVDDIAFADYDNAPSFAAPAVDFTLTWNADAITALTINGVVATASVGTATVKPNAEGKIVVTEICYADGYMAAEDQVTEFNAKDLQGVLKTVAVAFTDAGNNKFASLAKAIADGQGKITLAGAYTLAVEIVIGSGDKVIDLAGATITINGINRPVGGDAFYVEGGSLTIIDSVGGGKIVAAADQVASIIYNEGTVTIGSTEGFAPTFEGAMLLDGNSASIIKGKFDRVKNTVEAINSMLADPTTTEADDDGTYIVVKAKSASESVALTSVVLSTTTVEYGTTTAPTATVKAGETTVDAANYDISYSAELTATTAVGTEITVTATAKGTDYKGTASATFTVVAKAVTPAITLSATTAEFSDTLELPTVTVNGYTLDTDYTVAWDKSLPTVNPAEDVVLTVTVTMKGNYTGFNTATFTVTPKAASELPGEGFVENKTAYQAWAAANGITTETEATPDMAADLAVAFLLGANKTETVTLAEAAQAKVDELITAANIDVSKLATGDALTKEFQAALAANGLQAQLLPTTAADGLVSTATAKFFKLVIKLAVQNAE